MDEAGFLKAVAAGDSAAVDTALADCPALVESRTAQGCSALLWALYHRQGEMARRLAALRRDLDVFECAALGDDARLGATLAQTAEAVHAWSNDGFQPLHLAAFFARESTVDLLLRGAAEVNTPARHPDAMCPLHSAVAGRSHPVIERLLLAGAEPDRQQRGGFTALMAAAMHGDAVLVERLLAAGANPALATDDGRSAADFARAGGHLGLAERLQLPT